MMVKCEFWDVIGVQVVVLRAQSNKTLVGYLDLDELGGLAVVKRRFVDPGGEALVETVRYQVFL
jgi:hypothetical protein